MRFTRGKRRTGGDQYLMSLINIVFLILVFFMIMGRLSPPEVIEVDPPSSNAAGGGDGEGIVVLVGPDGRLAVGSEVVSEAGLAEAILRRSPAGAAPSPAVVVKADGRTRMDRLDGVLDTLRGIGAGRLSLVTDPAR